MVYKGWKIEEEWFKGNYVAWDLNDCDNHNQLCGDSIDSIKVEIDEYLDYLEDCSKYS
jgi:hypothetical protein